MKEVWRRGDSSSGALIFLGIAVIVGAVIFASARPVHAKAHLPLSHGDEWEVTGGDEDVAALSERVHALYELAQKAKKHYDEYKIAVAQSEPGMSAVADKCARDVRRFSEDILEGCRRLKASDLAAVSGTGMLIEDYEGFASSMLEQVPEVR